MSLSPVDTGGGGGGGGGGGVTDVVGSYAQAQTTASTVTNHDATRRALMESSRCRFAAWYCRLSNNVPTRCVP